MKNKTDTKFIKEALALAVKAEGLTSPNPLVGAVIVKGNKIIGRGYHKRAGSKHAEILALESAGKPAHQPATKLAGNRKAGGKTKGATLYINLEPCAHYGKTPPCAPEIIKAGIKRVVIAMPDPNPLVNGKGIKKLKSEGIDVQVGILEQDARKINETYIKYMTKKMPFVVLKWAMSLDGKIATRKGNSKWISGKASREFTQKLRGKFDAVLIGIETLLKDNPQLNTHGLEIKEPKRIIIDSKGRIPLDCNLLKTKGGQIIITTTDKISKKKIRDLKEKGAEIIVISSKEGRVDLKKLMIELAKREITSILVEGGGTINASFIENALADKFVAFLSPMIIGGKNAISPVEGKGIEKIANAVRIRDLSIRKMGEDVVMEGYL
ncbi:MAG: bifunctional diaminohydroxyphosphoribosylaminopyrimidine deaminase/5-amino-6-(5-phosphoribosylamino)uracil reductase RibD [Candidatus Omnitrophica bacterium]|nr:bifunctional diaminohydroxyphosphoribosylaminopyrimidine deaminase/5-amino-6-(5-phosphoribosylamino)uracil reductase RibD [Candidatus Omnitrophota bacterium]MBU1048226.1 bifunctional diaminohydroxyphosphoribosylaminopyrimidine deaminase/5-amino-6-(5-phosphoribosylamino)uracil reductase RibD [Candidatus Omnitrophota bacterium]MBU1631142.1 bifunctional diaminohydroxyphosphoribosylaminopyrimidine deaminase/5-amino-6-(5-phosphoribosylamino)uracil reductase RibD [Candidatus Omnitrophota bacterium]